MGTLPMIDHRTALEYRTKEEFLTGQMKLLLGTRSQWRLATGKSSRQSNGGGVEGSKEASWTNNRAGALKD